MPASSETTSEVASETRGAAIEVEGLRKTYDLKGGEQFTAVEDATFSVAPGEFVALIGPSGCGKSTILKIAAGLIDSTAGTVLIGAEPPKAGRRDLGIMLQRAVMLPWRTVTENVELPAALAGEDAQRRRARALEVLDLVGLSRVADAYPSELSGGMQQRAALARTLSYRPRTLLMDEPFGALDELTRERLNIEVAEIQSTLGATTILVTHSVQEAVFMADRILVMASNPGRILGEVVVDLPRPRRSELAETPAFLTASKRARQLIGIEHAHD